MGRKKFSFRGLFSKSNKECCKFEIEEVQPKENNNCLESLKEKNNRKKEE